MESKIFQTNKKIKEYTFKKNDCMSILVGKNILNSIIFDLIQTINIV